MKHEIPGQRKVCNPWTHPQNWSNLDALTWTVQGIPWRLYEIQVYQCCSSVRTLPLQSSHVVNLPAEWASPTKLTNLKASRATCTITKVHNYVTITKVHYWHPLDKRFLKNNISAKIVLSFGRVMNGGSQEQVYCCCQGDCLQAWMQIHTQVYISFLPVPHYLYHK